MTVTDNGKKGYKCVLKIGSAAMTIAQSVDPSLTADAIDITTRAAEGWRENLQGLKSWSLTVNHLNVPTDTQFEVLRAAFVSGDNVTVQFLDYDGYGWSGSAIVTELSRGEPIDGATTGSITITGDGPLTWVTPSS